MNTYLFHKMKVPRRVDIPIAVIWSADNFASANDKNEAKKMTYDSQK